MVKARKNWLRHIQPTYLCFDEVVVEVKPLGRFVAITGRGHQSLFEDNLCIQTEVSLLHRPNHDPLVGQGAPEPLELLVRTVVAAQFHLDGMSQYIGCL